MSLFKSVATFGGFTFVSRITGFLRDMVLANYLGAGAVSDAFLACVQNPQPVPQPVCRRSFYHRIRTNAFPQIGQRKEGRRPQFCI